MVQAKYGERRIPTGVVKHKEIKYRFCSRFFNRQQMYVRVAQRIQRMGGGTHGALCHLCPLVLKLGSSYRKDPKEGSKERFKRKVQKEGSKGRFKRKVQKEGSKGRIQRKDPKETLVSFFIHTSV